MWTIGIVMALLAAAGGGVYYRRLRRIRGSRNRELTDDLIRQIERQGRIEVEEPLDLDHIKDEEERFWDESAWENPDEW